MNDHTKVLNQLSRDAQVNEKAHLTLSDKLGKRHGLLSTCSNWLFILAVALGFPAVFTTSLLGYVPLGFAIIGCIMVWYRSRVDLTSQIEINMWFANRYWSLRNQCTSCLTEVEDQELAEEASKEIALLKDDYEKIVEDTNAWNSGVQTNVLMEFGAEQIERRRRSAAIGHKYNKHGIKQFV